MMVFLYEREYECGDVFVFFFLPGFEYVQRFAFTFIVSS